MGQPKVCAVTFRARFIPRASRRSQCCRLLSTLRDTVVEGDVVLLRPTRNRYSTADVLTNPLESNGKVKTQFGDVRHKDIIGRKVRENVTTRKKLELRIHVPSLSDYITLAPRRVTPVYPWDASLIVSLLDLEIPEPVRGLESPQAKPIEILEAGTGHGSLTLHLARAVHAANFQGSTPPNDDSDARNAVVHTLDSNPLNTAHARELIKNYARGIYLPNITFHTASVSTFLSSRIDTQPAPFSHIVLDYPAPHHDIPLAARALRPDGHLLVFCPSVTQIADCARAIRRHGVGLAFDQVVELQASTAGKPGRQWDVKVVRIRDAESRSEGVWKRWRRKLAEFIAPEVKGAGKGEAENGWGVVCRPLGGYRISGGGFIGLWRKRRDGELGDEEMDANS